MEYIYVCTKCGATFGMKNEHENKTCSECNVQLQYTGYTDLQWKKLSLQEKNSIKKYGTIKTQQQIELEEKQKITELAEKEKQKQEFANSFNEFYEYDIVTIINEDHGRIDRDNMMRVLSDHSRQGWKLHTIYSNELGKNALRILGFGTNSTACEDVLIFERRIEKID